MKPLQHECSACGQVDEIPGTLMAGCPTCLAPPGVRCINVGTAKAGEVLRVSHQRRVEISRRMDRARTGISDRRVLA